MDNASQEATCTLLLHQGQLHQALHPTSQPQDQSYTTSATSTVKRLMTNYKHIVNVLGINYKQQLTNGMNPDYARELPAHYLKHWGLLVDTGAYVSVAPRHFAPEVLLEAVLQPVQPLTATSTPIKIYGTKTVLLVSGRLSFHVRLATSQT